MKPDRDDLKEIVSDAMKNLDTALKKLEKFRTAMEPDEVRGLELALKGIAAKPPSMTDSSRRTLKTMLDNLLTGSASDGFDRGYAAALLEYIDMTTSGKEEGQVQAVGDKPDEDKGTDAMGINR
ncbi:MAG: hypothetical protein JRN68_08360 [Nitrososphaerota archaeon]|jgi:hypothetical protein|nr:hypothetical protein [Nitrososphaerota archaeon]